MKVETRFAAPEGIEITITATMTIAQWRIIEDALNENAHFHKYPNEQLRKAIREASNTLAAKVTVEVETAQ